VPPKVAEIAAQAAAKVATADPADEFEESFETTGVIGEPSTSAAKEAVASAQADPAKAGDSLPPPDTPTSPGGDSTAARLKKGRTVAVDYDDFEEEFEEDAPAPAPVAVPTMAATTALAPAEKMKAASPSGYPAPTGNSPDAPTAIPLAPASLPEPKPLQVIGVTAADVPIATLPAMAHIPEPKALQVTEVAPPSQVAAKAQVMGAAPPAPVAAQVTAATGYDDEDDEDFENTFEEDNLPAADTLAAAPPVVPATIVEPVPTAAPEIAPAPEPAPVPSPAPASAPPTSPSRHGKDAYSDDDFEEGPESPSKIGGMSLPSVSPAKPSPNAPPVVPATIAERVPTAAPEMAPAPKPAPVPSPAPASAQPPSPLRQGDSAYSDDDFEDGPESPSRTVEMSLPPVSPAKPSPKASRVVPATIAERVPTAAPEMAPAPEAAPVPSPTPALAPPTSPSRQGDDAYSDDDFEDGPESPSKIVEMSLPPVSPAKPSPKGKNSDGSGSSATRASTSDPTGRPQAEASDNEENAYDEGFETDEPTSLPTSPQARLKPADRTKDSVVVDGHSFDYAEDEFEDGSEASKDVSNEDKGSVKSVDD